jgi:hypothetical protein
VLSLMLFTILLVNTLVRQSVVGNLEIKRVCGLQFFHIGKRVSGVHCWDTEGSG